MNGVAQRCKRRHLEYKSQPDSRECQRLIRHLSVLCCPTIQQHVALLYLHTIYATAAEKRNGDCLNHDKWTRVYIFRRRTFWNCSLAKRVAAICHAILQWLMAMSAGYMYSSDFEQCFVAEITRYAACSLPLSSAYSDKHLFGFAFRQQLSHVIAPQTEGMMILRAPGKIWNMISNRRT